MPIPPHPMSPSLRSSKTQFPPLTFLCYPPNRQIYGPELSKSLRERVKSMGNYTVINHGVPENLAKEMVDGCGKFFDLTEEEKRVYEGKHVLDPIRCGTSFNTSVEKSLFWRDYLKMFVHPEFHAPTKPEGFSELALEYRKRVKEVALKLLGGISESLGLEERCIENALNLQRGLQVMIVNLYPPCPQPELGMGPGPHSDHGLLTLVVQNGIGGLQVQHRGKWVPVTPRPNSFLVNTADQIEILSNGKYKSVVHRAVVNNRATRISIASLLAPPMDAVVGPSVYLTNGEKNPPAYAPVSYGQYMELYQSSCLDGKSAIDRGAVLVCALPWLRSLLLQHASGIMSHESSLLALNSLFQIVDEGEDKEDTITPAIFEDGDESDEELEDAVETGQESEQQEPVYNLSDMEEESVGFSD